CARMGDDYDGGGYFDYW
nr:immunoglobulin heavy chain junction region [Mus musculus]